MSQQSDYSLYFLSSFHNFSYICLDLKVTQIDWKLNIDDGSGLFWNIRSSRELSISIVHSRPGSCGADIITIRSRAAKTEQPLISNYFLGIWSAWARTWRSFNLSATCPKSWHSSCGGASWPRGPSRRRCRRASGCSAGSSRCRPATSASRPSPRWPRVPRAR